MSNRKKIIVLCGSNRKDSVNLSLIRSITNFFASEVEWDIFLKLHKLPHFNPDSDNEGPPVEVKHFRERLHSADGILICTPEYAMGVPGCLKNALDWTVSSMEFSDKPTALITASSKGEKAHASLMVTLKVIGAALAFKSQLLIPFAKTKVMDNSIIDQLTFHQVQRVIHSLTLMIQKKDRRI